MAGRGIVRLVPPSSAQQHQQCRAFAIESREAVADDLDVKCADQLDGVGSDGSCRIHEA
jgi:hypothetical protein